MNKHPYPADHVIGKPHIAPAAQPELPGQAVAPVIAPVMRAKMEIFNVENAYSGAVLLTLHAVCGEEHFGPDGESENNTFARWTPNAHLQMIITNPALVDKFQAGQKFYVDFTEAK